MKNFKKVISVVMALAMIVCSFTTVSAAKFADVADTAAYAEAVEVLKALGVASGVEQENGTFNFEPEKTVTRAEAVTLIVGALNLANEAAAGTSQFADVNSQAAWAAGYVNVGVAQGFIAGYDANTFGPLDNVTYAQLCVMLTKITGYGEYAQAYGGWPTGYTTMAATAGINEGVAVASDAALTKGQVAMMIWNALQAPMLGVKTYAINGNEYEPLDGTNGKFKTLFSEKFDGFTAKVTIDGTPLTKQVEDDVVDFTVTDADWWLETKETIPNNTNAILTKQDVEFVDVDVNGNFLQSGKAVFVLDEDDAPVMIYFKAANKAASKDFAADTYYLQADLVDSKQFATGHEKIRFGSSYYKFDSSIAVYVNGVYHTTITAAADQVADTQSQQDLDWILGNAQGTIKAVKAGSAVDYNTLFVKFYQIGEIASIDADEDETEITLNGVASALDNTTAGLDKIVISKEAVEEGKVAVTVTRNGEAATLDSLVNGDIIAYATAFDVADINDPKEIDIIATNDTVAGVVTAVDENLAGADDNEYTIDGTEYGVVPGKFQTISVAVKNSLDVTLDPFGRIWYYETNASSANYAIALKLGTEDNFIKLLLADGTTKTYEVDTAKATNFTADFVTDRINNEANVEDRIVTYEVSGKNGKIVSINKVASNALNSEYKARTSLLGSANKILESTPIIRAAENTVLTSEAEKYSVVTKADLLDQTVYTGRICKINNTVAFVVLETVGTTFGEASRFAVAIDTPELVLTEDSDRVQSVKVLYDGDVTDLLFTLNTQVPSVGTAFFFETDADGYVNVTYVPAANNQAWNNKITQADWSYVLWDTHTPIQFVSGIVTEVTSNGISFATVAQVQSGSLDMTLDLDDTQADGIVTYGIADDCVAYTYDSGMKTRVETDKYSKAAPSSIKASNFAAFDSAAGILNDGRYAETNAGDMMAKATEATAMIVDGEIVAIFAIEK